MSFYKITEIPGMNGFIAVGDLIKNNGHEEYELINVETLINTDIMVGDRQLRYPIPKGAFWLNRNYVKEIDDPGIREYSAENDFGDLEYEGTYEKGRIRVSYASYKNVLTIDVKDTSVNPIRTVYSQNYYDDHRVDAEKSVVGSLRIDDGLEDLVFLLKDIAEKQRNGTQGES
jgi:hypothetical protein